MKKKIDKALFILWAVILFFSTSCGMSAIVGQFKWIDSDISNGIGFMFSALSFYYIVYKYEKLREPKEQ